MVTLCALYFSDVAYKGIPGGIDSSDRSLTKHPTSSDSLRGIEENDQYPELPDLEVSPYEPSLRLTFRNVRSEFPNVSFHQSPKDKNDRQMGKYYFIVGK